MLIVGKVRGRLLLAELVETVGNQSVQVDEKCTTSLGCIRRPGRVAVEAALDLAFHPDVAWHRRAKDGCRSLGLGVLGVLPQVPPVSVDDLLVTRFGRGDFLRLVAAAL